MKDLSIYIHIPFCKTICVYCGFLTFANKGKLIPDYLEALHREIVGKAEGFRKRRTVSIYFGGGTPSLLTSDQVNGILDLVRKNFDITNTAEITLECNPESIDPEKLRAYKKAGVNRISLGVQSLDRKCLWRVARSHDEKTALEAVDTIKHSRIRNFGLDFIIGLPYQNLTSFKKELKQILEYKPPHLSYYFLSPDTKKIDLIKADCPSEEEQLKMYKHLTMTLEKTGYIHYEVSNYALPGFECRHNLRYWNQLEYLGLGLGAHSYYDRQCTENENDFGKYLQNPLKIADRFPIDDELDQLEYVMLQLRTRKGLDLEIYKKKNGDPVALLKRAKKYLQKGLLKFDGKRLSPGDKGFLIIDSITNDLI